MNDVCKKISGRLISRFEDVHWSPKRVNESKSRTIDEFKDAIRTEIVLIMGFLLQRVLSNFLNRLTPRYQQDGRHGGSTNFLKTEMAPIRL